MTRYRCGPLGENGCGHVFEFDDGPDGLFAPMWCPSCDCTFCGYDCCGNVAEDLDWSERLARQDALKETK